MLDNLDGDYEYIIAEGGLNDFWGHSELGEITDGFSGDFDENTMTGGMEKMFFEIRNDFPNSKVGFVITHDPFTYDAEGNFESYYERIKEVCDKWDVSYLDLYAKNNSRYEKNSNCCFYDPHPQFSLFHTFSSKIPT